MPKLKEYRDTERALTEAIEYFEELKKNIDLMKELEFEKKLLTFLKRHNKRMVDLVAFIKPVLADNLYIQEQRPSYRRTTGKKPTTRTVKRVSKPE
ncbi:MAG TPA: hypothetical protein VF682_10285 [Pseudomonas sp.]